MQLSSMEIEVRTASPLSGVQGVRPLVSRDSALHGKGPQNDQQQAGNFGVHNYLYYNRKQDSKRRENNCTTFL